MGGKFNGPLKILDEKVCQISEKNISPKVEMTIRVNIVTLGKKVSKISPKVEMTIQLNTVIFLLYYR